MGAGKFQTVRAFVSLYSKTGMRFILPEKSGGIVAKDTMKGTWSKVVDAWAVYNLPILPKVLDLIVNHIYENLESFIDFDGLEEYLEDIEWEYEENKTPDSKPFEEYLRSCIEEDLVVEWVKNDYLLKQVFDAVKDEVSWEYLEFVWTRFCSSHEFNSALYLVKDTVKKIVPKVVALTSSVG